MPIRVKISEFGIIQKALGLAVVTVFEADGNGDSTGTKATIYQALTGTDSRVNPQTLDADGKLTTDCYVETDVVASISGITERTERSLKKIKQSPLAYALPVTSSNFFYTNSIGAAAAAAAALVSETNAAASEANAATSETNSATSETNAAASETAAQVAQAAAEAAMNGALWAGGVVAKTFADSPITLTDADAGVYFNIDTSGGNVIVNLPSIASIGEPGTIGLKKATADGNTITVNRNGTDEIDDSTSAVTLQNNQEARVFSADIDPTPDNWVTASFGTSSGNFIIDIFEDVTDYTSGTTTQLTLSVDPGSENNVDFTFDGVVQHHDTFSIAALVVTFTSAIPLDTAKIEAKIGASSEISTPADASVTVSKMSSGAAADGDVATADGAGGVAYEPIPAKGVTNYERTDITAVGSTTAQIPCDGTPPLVAEGTAVGTYSYTPLSITATVIVELNILYSANNNSPVSFSMFLDAGGTAVAACSELHNNGGTIEPAAQKIKYSFVPGALDEIDFNIRYGPGSGITAYLNSLDGSTLLFGAANNSHISFTELEL